MEYFSDLSRKTALITGASSGIGLHFAHTLANAGAKVILTARRKQQLDLAVAQIQSRGGIAARAVMDVTSKRSVDAAFESAGKIFGRIDVVVNNAGIASGGKALEVSESQWDQVIDTNLKGVWLAAQAAAQMMSADCRGGSLINIASILGIRVMGGVVPYAVSKAAVDHLTRVLAYEWAVHGIRVNTIAPGYVLTDMNRAWLQSPAGEKAKHKIPQRRFGQVQDLEGPMLLLASDASSYMTGATIVVDGGHLQSSM